MRIGNSATDKSWLGSCAWVERFVRMLTRITMRGCAKWRENRRRTRYAYVVVRDGHRLSVAMARDKRGLMLRVVCTTHHGSSCTDGVMFFMADERRDHSLPEKLWAAIRKKGGER